MERCDVDTGVDEREAALAGFFVHGQSEEVVWMARLESIGVGLESKPVWNLED